MMKLRNKAYLVIVQNPKQQEDDFLEESAAEMRELAAAAAIQVAGLLRAKISQLSPSHYVREGKLSEIGIEAKKNGANVLVFNIDLTPVQARNIEAFTKIPAMDRTGLILEIFGRRAKSKEGKTQVELARLNYLLPRIGGLGTVMSRLGGGIGTRGPGEQELEHDRRKIRKRIKNLQDQLKKVHRHRQTIRSARKKRSLVSVALVGYTNAGKSSLLNALTGADTYVEDKMFATLDPKAKLQNLGNQKNILLIDTVGFLRDLPHTLVEAFHATLEEVIESDLLIHVLDVSQSNCEELYLAVMKVLTELGVMQKPILLALNKADLLSDVEKLLIEQRWPEGVLISATQKKGLRLLLHKLEAKMKGEEAKPFYG